MAPIRITSFGGIAPKVDPRSLPDNAAQVAENVDLERGHLRPWYAPAVAGTLSVSGARSIYPYRGAWLAWSGLVNVVKGPLEDDQYDRIYWTGDGAPKVRGLIGTTPTTYPLGVPKPTAALTVTIEAKTAVTWTRTWRYFYEEPDGTQKDSGTLVEGPGGVQVVTAGRQFRVTSIPPRVTASSNAVFVLYFDAYKANGVLFGRCYPTISQYSGNSDMYVNGAKITGTQTTASGILTFKLGYNTTTETRSFTVQVGRRTTVRTQDVEVEQPSLVKLYYTQEKAWVYTFVTAWGEEGPPSDPTSVYAMDPSQQAILTGFQTSVSGGYNIAKVRIYRTVTGDAGTEFAYVGEMTLGTSSFTDAVDDEDTNETLPSTVWYAPPEGLSGLVGLPGEFMAGFVGKTVYFSEPGYPHAWPAGYGVTVEDPVVALGVSGNNLVILTTGKPYVCTVPEPGSASVLQVPSPQSCVSAAGVVEMGGAVLYPSPDGLVMMSGLTATVVSGPYFTKPQWQEYSPSTMVARVFDDRLFLFSSTATLIISFAGQASMTITTSTERATAAHYFGQQDALFLAQGANLTKWDEGSTVLTARWRSREYALPRPLDPACGRVTADAYPLTYRAIDVDGTAFSRTVRSDTAFRMPRARPEKFWSFEVEGQQVVRELVSTGSMTDL